MVAAAIKSEETASWQENDDKYRQCVEKQKHYSANTGPYSQGSGIPSGHVWLWELDYKGGRVPKNWCLRTVVMERTPESPSESEEIKPVNLKGNQLWIFIGRTDAEAKAPVFWSTDVNSRLIAWCWERLRAKGVEGIRGWDGWMVSPMQWTWTWANFRRWWRTERPSVLQSMVLQKFRHDCVRATEQQKGILLNINGVFIIILKTQFFISSFLYC